jgi:hypothetical protein
LAGEQQVRPVTFGHQHQAAGILVQAVDDAGALFPPDAGQMV